MFTLPLRTATPIERFTIKLFIDHISPDCPSSLHMYVPGANLHREIHASYNLKDHLLRERRWLHYSRQGGGGELRRGRVRRSLGADAVPSISPACDWSGLAPPLATSRLVFPDYASDVKLFLQDVERSLAINHVCY